MSLFCQFSLLRLLKGNRKNFMMMKMVKISGKLSVMLMLLINELLLLGIIV